MRLSSFQVPVCLLALASYAAAEASADASDVLKLTAETFEKSVSDNSLVLVEFFAPWYIVSCLLFWSYRLTLSPGVDTARLLLLITKRLQPPSRTRTLSSLQSTVSTKLSFARLTVFRDTPHSRSTRMALLLTTVDPGKLMESLAT